MKNSRACLLAFIANVCCGLAYADDTAARFKLNIEPQSLGSALMAFGEQSGIQVLMKIEDTVVEKEKTPRLVGEFTVQGALERLLRDSGLRYEFVNERTVRVSAADERASVPEVAGVRLAQAEGEGSAAGNVQLRQSTQTSDQASSPKDTAAEFERLEEIVVSATKRDEPLQDIPLSVSVLDEQLLIKTGDTNLVDYAKRVPNLAFAATGGGGPFTLYSMQIRGVTGTGTTGFYIDDVPLIEGMNPRVLDISRIEVLRGPQGSLYGARSMGGTVRLITKHADPTATEFQTHAYVGAVAEGDQDYAVDSAFNVPLASNLAFRSNVYYQRETGIHDIVVDNPLVVGDEVTHKNADKGEYWGLQALATWTPTEHLTVEPRFMYQNSHVDWVPYSDLRPGNFTQRRVIDLADPNDDEWSVSSLTVSWDMDWGRFTSATAFLDEKLHGREEFSEAMNYFSGNPNYYPPGGILLDGALEYRRFTEEARFTSQFNGPLQLTAGVFYSKTEAEVHAPCFLAIGFGEAVGDPSIPDCIYSQDSLQKTDETAVFGELQYALLDDLVLTLGGRYFDNTVSLSAVTAGYFGVGLQNGEQSEDGFNPKVALKWEATPDWTLYSSVAKGYRIGGANLGAFPPRCASDLADLGLSAVPERYDSDSLWSYEIGSKSAHADRRFSLNVAAFKIDWSDMIQGVILPCGAALTTNIGKAEIKGAEVEINGHAGEGFHYALGVGYADSEVTDPGQFTNVYSKGDPIQQVPQWTINGNMDYRFNLGAREGYFFLSYSWVDSSISRTQGAAAPPRPREAYDVLDARLGTTFGKWDVSLFGKNLTNQHANLSDNLSNAIEDPRRPRYVTNRPRTIGVDVRWAF